MRCPLSGAAGESWRLKVSGGAHGHAVTHSGRVVHLVVYPYDPFLTRLYAGTMKAPKDDSKKDAPAGGAGDDGPDVKGGGDVPRDLPGRRLSVSEQRLLDRMNENRGGGTRRR